MYFKNIFAENLFFLQKVLYFIKDFYLSRAYNANKCSTTAKVY